MDFDTKLPFEIPPASKKIGDKRLRQAVTTYLTGYATKLEAHATMLSEAGELETAPLRSAIDSKLGLASQTTLIERRLNKMAEVASGNGLENLARELGKIARGALKCPAKGIDLFFSIEDELAESFFLLSIKSTLPWGNDSQQNALATHFKQAQKSLFTSPGAKKQFAWNLVGACSGPPSSGRLSRESFYHTAGSEFWMLLTGDPEMYERVIAMVDLVANSIDLTKSVAAAKAAIDLALAGAAA